MRRLSVYVAAAAVAGGLAAGRAPAQTYTVLHSFAGTSDGAFPIAGVVVGPDETLYGTAMSGGAAGGGTIFSYGQAGNFVILHTFEGPDGAGPQNGSLTLLQNTLYGPVLSGGTAGCGVVFSMQSDGSAYTLLHSFSGTEGCEPTGTLQYVPGHGLVGVTKSGGPGFSSPSFGRGVLFGLTRNGSYRKLHDFVLDSDGRSPNAVLVDSAGDVFGSTSIGGGKCSSGAAGCGVIFKLNLETRQYSVLYRFTGQEDGRNPILGSIGPDGTLYGATTGGGTGRAGAGTVFALSPAGNGYRLETVAYSLPSLGLPAGGPTLTTGGALIGVTTLALYIHNRGPGHVLEPLTGGPNGGEAIGQPAIGSGGTIYGTTVNGGVLPCPVEKNPLGCGVLYRYTAR